MKVKVIPIITGQLEKFLTAELQKKATVEKKHILDESITNITPTNAITNETRNTYTNQILSLSVR
jgi:hypothetical protein